MDSTLQRLLAASAFAGGLLRIMDAFMVGTLSAQLLQLAYAATDVFLLLGLAGTLLTWRDELERLGYVGVAVAAIGLTIIRATGFSSLAMDGYLIGAAVAVSGMALLGADLLWRRVGSRLAPYLWLVAFALVVWGWVGGQAALQALAGIAFGAGFLVAAIDLLAAEIERATPG